MKDALNTSTTTPRRRFTKSLAVLLLTLPLALSLVIAPDAAAQSKRRNSRAARQKSSARNFRDHIPPMTLTDGSLKLVTPEFSSEEHGGPDNRPHRYKKTGFRHIYQVQLWDISDVDVLLMKDFDNLNSGWRLHIWLEEQQTDGSYKLVPPADDNKPQIIVRGSSLDIETDKELKNPQPTGIPNLPSKYDYPPYSPAHFRIARAWVCRNKCSGKNDRQILLDSGSNRNKVHIKIFFRH